ncbi:hypothetical protein AMS68_003386 [Peltaster fructicola]|uniref:Uncharacterized protein n=1 Tax=Peltaster fructicola TaxID=286661 RepID=A0A6H0XTC4_9PEZI|nr:hypothetical protein AMS68_003386 [Peltaster fructicola]
MEGVDSKLPVVNPQRHTTPHIFESNTPANISERALSRAKFAIGRFIRNTLHYRRPSHKRASSTGKTGFVLPAGPRDTATPLGHRGSYQSNNSSRNSRSVRSVRSVRRSGNTPHILVTRPTARGRQSRLIHRGTDVRSKTRKQHSVKQLRYSHPTATAIINSSWVDLNQSTASLNSEIIMHDSDSCLSAPKTVDLARDFPDEVNVRKIARESSFGYEDAKAVVDGVKPRSEAAKLGVVSSSSVISSHRRTTSTPIYQAYKTDNTHGKLPAWTQEEHRHATFHALTSNEQPTISQTSVYRHSLPDNLLPGPPSARQRLSIAASLTSTNGGFTWLDDEEIVDATPSSPGPVRPKLAQHDSIGFIPYSKFDESLAIDSAYPRDSLISSHSDCAAYKRDTSQSVRHRQVYDSVENLKESFESFNEALYAASRPSKAPKDKPTVPDALKMIENGFPHIGAQPVKFSAEPKYEKRTLTGDELKALKKEEKRKSRLANPQKKAREAARAEARMTVLTRMRKSLNV